MKELLSVYVYLTAILPIWLIYYSTHYRLSNPLPPAFSLNTTPPGRLIGFIRYLFGIFKNLGALLDYFPLSLYRREIKSLEREVI